MYLSLKCGYVSLSQLFYLIHFSTKLIRGTTVYMQTFASVLFLVLMPSLSTCEFKTGCIKNNFAGRKGWKITLYTVPLLMIYTLHNKFGKILWCSDKKTCYIASWNYQSRHESVSTRIQSWGDILKTSKLHAHGAQCFLTSITDRKESLHDTEQRKSQSLTGPRALNLR